MGEAGLVEQSSAEANSLKTMAKGLSCYSSEQQPRQPVGQIKGYSHDISTKEKES